MLIASISHLSATTTDNMLTQKKVMEIYEHFDSMTKNCKLIKGKSTTQQISTLEKKINVSKNEIIKLINSDKNIINQTNTKDPKETFLIRATARNQTDIIDILLKKGAKIDATDKVGHTPLMYATMNDLHSTLKFLLKRGANPTIKNIEGYTALNLANLILKALNNEAPTDNNIKSFEKIPKIEATKKTIKLLRAALMYFYAKRALWALVAALLVVLTGWGIHHYILEPRADTYGLGDK